MLADGFTFAAQIVNFLILVWMLRRWLFQPVMRAVEARESKLAAAQKEAQAKQADADAEKRRWEKERADQEAAREALMRGAESEAAARREEALARIRSEAAAESSKWRAAFEAEKKTQEGELSAHILREAFALSAKVVKELADESLEQAAAETLLRKLSAMDERARAELLNGAVAAGHPITLRSAADLGPEARDRLSTSLRMIFKTDVPILFEMDPALIWGLELSAGDVVLPWSAEAAGAALLARAEAALEAHDHGP